MSAGKGMSLSLDKQTKLIQLLSLCFTLISSDGSDARFFGSYDFHAHFYWHLFAYFITFLPTVQSLCS